MKTLVQVTPYTGQRVLQIIDAIENARLFGKNEIQNLSDSFFDVTSCLRSYIYVENREHYFYEHIACYLESIAKANPNYNREAFESIMSAFDINGKYH